MALLLQQPLAKASGFFILVFLMVLGSGCALLRDTAKPEISVTSLSLQPSRGFTQTLNIGVRVRNTNGFGLNINTLNYRIFLEDTEVAFGKRTEKLEIGANDSVSFTVPVELNLLSGLSLIQKLLNAPKDELAYRMEVDADVANFGLGMMRIQRESTVSLVPR
ncbi:LEA type 2 family protein [Litorivivens sp.]|uniref:LEA type 2 family protein n=1 Tax=Litorivivens sp. TaxID=2020868 RepID=UPI003563C6D1